MKTIYFWKQQQ